MSLIGIFLGNLNKIRYRRHCFTLLECDDRKTGEIDAKDTTVNIHNKATKYNIKLFNYFV